MENDDLAGEKFNYFLYEIWKRIMSRDTPLPVARQLRQEAGFGCCVCGKPIIQYHHIIEYAQEEHFRPEDMMVLCPLDHDRATKKAFPEEEQREYKANPYNKQRGYAQGLLEVKQDYSAVALGTVFMVGEGACLRVNQENLLSIAMGEKNLEISLLLYDENDNLILYIDRNEWVSGDLLPWDIEADWQKLLIRHKSRDIRIELNAQTKPPTIKCKLWRNGERITINESGIFIDNVKCALKNIALVGGVIEVTSQKGVTVGPYAQGKDYVFVSRENPRERLWQAVAAWKKLNLI